jgi:quinoprotein glucose dehydrogenase
MQQRDWKACAATAVLLLLCGAVAAREKRSSVTVSAAEKTPAFVNWSTYGGANGDDQYSPLKQVNRANAAKLQQVWFYPAGGNGFRYGSNPLVVDGVMFVWGKNNNVVALDATTGKEVWVYDTSNPRAVSHRGMSYWESKDRSDRRVFFAANNQLYALDAKTGKLVTSFGNSGAVDLREGLGRPLSSVRQIESGTPGRVFENLIIEGSATGEEYESPPGDIRAYDAVTGKLAWQFHTVPHPGEMGYDTWPPEAYKYSGGTNNWGDFAIDEKRGIAYFPLGSPTYDFYGADRHGANLFSDCLLALDARTGKYLWHFQATHHDLWDYDLESGPKLMTIQHDGKPVDVIVQAGKNGFLWILDRTNGKPIWPVEERAVPKSEVPNEASWPTQPFPTHVPPFARQKFSADMVDPYIADPKEREEIKQQVLAAHNEGIYTPPSLETTMETPGNNGGANWGTSAMDPETRTFYVMSKDAPSLLHLEIQQPRRTIQGSAENQGEVLYAQRCQLCHQANLKGQPPAIPSLVGVVQRSGPQRVHQAIHDGIPPMPAIPDMTDPDIEKIIAYLTAPEKATLAPDMLVRFLAPPPSNSRIAPAGTRYWTGYGYMNSKEGLPAISPPWSTLTAYDVTAGTIKWQIPIGDVDFLAAKGITGTGSFWPRGGDVVTAGGLVIVPTKSDETLHIYDKDTGKQIAALKMPVSPEGIPTVYEVDGREYIAISARPNTDRIGELGDEQDPAAGGPMPRRITDTKGQGYYVFALPEASAKH